MEQSAFPALHKKMGTHDENIATERHGRKKRCTVFVNAAICARGKAAGQRRAKKNIIRVKMSDYRRAKRHSIIFWFRRQFSPLPFKITPSHIVDPKQQNCESQYALSGKKRCRMKANNRIRIKRPAKALPPHPNESKKNSGIGNALCALEKRGFFYRH